MDYYSILGVARNASPEDIKKSYKRLSMKHHPDRGGNNDDFIKVQQAYEVLSKSDKRNAYDHPHSAHDMFGQQQGRNPFAGSPFENMFNQGFQNRTPRNMDIDVRANINLEDVLTGKNLLISYSLQTGRQETVQVDIPAGAKHGDTVQYEGLGDEGHPGIRRGNLNVRIFIHKKRDWERDHDNLIVKKAINVLDFLTGCVILVTTLENKRLELKIPKGTQIGTTFGIPEHGMPNMQTRRRGKLFVTVEAIIPVINDEAVITRLHEIKKDL